MQKNKNGRQYNWAVYCTFNLVIGICATKMMIVQLLSKYDFQKANKLPLNIATLWDWLSNHLIFI